MRTPINLPFWGHIAQLCGYCSFNDDNRPRAMARADRADAYKRLSLLEKDPLTAGATPRRPKRYGFAAGAQLFGPTATLLHMYSCLSVVLASTSCRFPRIPCVGYYDD